MKSNKFFIADKYKDQKKFWFKNGDNGNFERLYLAGQNQKEVIQLNKSVCNRFKGDIENENDVSKFFFDYIELFQEYSWFEILSEAKESHKQAGKSWFIDNGFVTAIELEDVILDCETTGLYDDAEICELSIIDSDGEVLFHSLIKPKSPIPSRATRIHNITNQMVEDAPTWDQVHAEVCHILKDKMVNIYNASFDLGMLVQTAALYDLEFPEVHSHCVMLEYAELFGEWNDYYQNHSWQKLSYAMIQQKIDTSDLTAHRALSDCQMTLKLLKKIKSGEIRSLDQSVFDSRKNRIGKIIKKAADKLEEIKKIDTEHGGKSWLRNLYISFNKRFNDLKDEFKSEYDDGDEIVIEKIVTVLDEIKSLYHIYKETYLDKEVINND